ncbi:NAD(P)-binding protein [Aaosphaeria arxii CBS 175.79]|uniref:NAD(P)-binding protein n=1 Tax=Aaosphaeria arxii CBS 175.79 TaxID=1450172 RepID=A0A6A5X6H3_9PLEO|nr:NAD(P)-binding protein [Aaosphaeria arxii CBS 175.79]KAF2008466.1 NAD(P)-binding protein [Aaosphaeria arxii CBS 175.79]
MVEAPIALITGCNSGIGKQLALAFAVRGVTVLATARRTESLEDLVKQHSNIEAFALELGNPGSIGRLRDAVIKRTGGRLDFLVNNAGTHYAATALDLEVREAMKLFNVNVFAVMSLCQTFVPLLLKSSRGRIVQIGSVTRDVPMVWQGAYNASKAALSQYTKTLRLELAPLGIEVVEIITGFVRSNILHHGLHAPEESLYLPIKATIQQLKYEGNATDCYDISSLERYFHIAQDVNPIFSKARFLDSYRNSDCDNSLISTITAITAKLTNSISSVSSDAIDARIDLLLSSTTVQDDLFTNFPSLDQFRKSCVLAFYEFHQFPGHQSWTRIGNLTRVAYRVGLDRLENLRKLHHEWRILSDQDVDEWRAVWWCIYRLDSYSNLASGTPYLIDEDLISTSLILRSPAQSQITDNDFPQILLSAEPENLWKFLPSIISHPESLISNIHNITVTMMRQAAYLNRICPVRPKEEAIERVVNVKRQLSALRLALPPGWLNPKRNAFSYESHADHHARLVTVLHLLMSHLLLSVYHCVRQQEEEALMSWQQVIEACQNIALIAEQWDSFFCIQVDPAISFVVFTALIFLDLHRKSTTVSTLDVHARIDHDRTALCLQLEQFARLWTLPKLLKLSFATFSEAIPGPLDFRHIKRILAYFESPLHPRWLQFLSSPQTYLDNWQNL